MLVIQVREKKRIRQFNSIKKNYIKILFSIIRDYVYSLIYKIEKEKGLLRFQFNKGICMTIKYKGYNSSFQIRSVIETVAIEQQFLTYSNLIF